MLWVFPTPENFFFSILQRSNQFLVNHYEKTKELLSLPEINQQEVQKYFKKYGQMERYYDIVGEKQKK